MYGLVDRSPNVSVDGQGSVAASLISLSVNKCCCKGKIKTVACAVEAINSVFSKSCPNSCDTWIERKARILEILNRIDFEETELGKYTYYDNAIPYTRNLLATDGENYTLLLLCWSPGRESKIHDHPCQGCFVRTIEGKIQEWIYSANRQSGEIEFVREGVYGQGLTSFMSDEVGLHKIGNPDPVKGAVSLHLYVPPFRSCKVMFQLFCLF